jgi:hypothetical protein
MGCEAIAEVPRALYELARRTVKKSVDTIILHRGSSPRITSGGAYDPATENACRVFVMRLVRAYLARLKRCSDRSTSWQKPNLAHQARTPALHRAVTLPTG